MLCDDLQKMPHFVAVRDGRIAKIGEISACLRPAVVLAPLKSRLDLHIDDRALAGFVHAEQIQRRCQSQWHAADRHLRHKRPQTKLAQSADDPDRIVMQAQGETPCNPRGAERRRDKGGELGVDADAAGGAAGGLAARGYVEWDGVEELVELCGEAVERLAVDGETLKRSAFDGVWPGCD